MSPTHHHIPRNIHQSRPHTHWKKNYPKSPMNCASAPTQWLHCLVPLTTSPNKKSHSSLTCKDISLEDTQHERQRVGCICQQFSKSTWKPCSCFGLLCQEKYPDNFFCSNCEYADDMEHTKLNCNSIILKAYINMFSHTNCIHPTHKKPAPSLIKQSNTHLGNLLLSQEYFTVIKIPMMMRAMFQSTEQQCHDCLSLY